MISLRNFISCLTALLVTIGLSPFAGAFRSADVQHQPVKQQQDVTSVANTQRRQFLSKGAGALSLLIANQPARASYSAYANREKDWQERNTKGEVNVSSARELRAQLREIAPMNSEGSKIFCPNGESSAVSPMMENKCGDRKALPSVYGRSEDSMGNSIPGFSGATGASASTLRAELGAQAYFRES